MRKKILSFFGALLFSLSIVGVILAATNPMLKDYVGWDYGKTGNYFSGYVPALDKKVDDHKWELYRWTGIFNFEDGGSSTISNYDVFNVKDAPDEPSFKKENGFGLTLKSSDAVGDLFDSIWKTTPAGIREIQMIYYREKFTERGTNYDSSNPYYYTVNNIGFLRTAGIIERMGVKFDQSKKISSDNYQAIFQVSKWPTMKVTQGDALNISFTASGYSERNIRLIAVPKGAFPDLSTVVSLNDGKLINTADESYSGSVEVNARDISSVLGSDVDIILDDGYGRTVIESVKLPNDQAMDYVPTKLTLTEGGQIWVKFRYDGDDIISSDYVNARGIPMNAAVKVGGAVTTEFNLPSMNTQIAQSIINGQEFSYMLGKIEISDAPGKYYIKIDTVVNNPNHTDRALESPAEAYKNNTIHGEWTIERKAPDADLIAVSITASPSTIQKGNQSVISAKVKNDSDEIQSSVLIRFTDNTQTIYEVKKTIPANQTIMVGPFSWTGESIGMHNLSVHVDPEKEMPDKDRSNNVASTGCSVNSTSSNNDGTECNNTEMNKTWKVTYPLITGYPTKTRSVTYVDSKGKTHTSSESYTDYSDPIWEYREVTYQEKLTISSEVDTKQNIPTDLKNPKESDRESRGSWGIIPYANKNSKNASEITRAGYGFTLKVNTAYTTDWETKVPVGLANTARPIGGQYYGPDTVFAMVYDTKGRFVKKIDLEKTSGDRNAATWELPKVTTKSSSGKSYTDRKFFTDVDAPDGYYTVKIFSGPAGMTGFSVCVTKKIEIWGSLYDDVQNLKNSD
ncbi:hypothetical protein FHR92_002960 [Fontibacillus solani]|uniref:CARDB domain-containing protein n=1 Tax=Fontibacillus solani TaxID=1572857 RepID=A0A7W3SUM3_9BACL|nr:CARDB domain-containing protein [Fontibacillus solani]MBA9086482.1 hypothetical protein [Fontibacillus solani]